MGKVEVLSREDLHTSHPVIFSGDLSPFVPLPLGIYEGKGEFFEREAKPLLNSP